LRDAVTGISPERADRLSADNSRAILAILEKLPVPVVVANPVTAEILWVNSRIVKMAAARSADDIIGASLFDFIQPPQISKALADLARVAVRQAPPSVTYHMRRANGESAAAQVASVAMTFRGQPAMLSIVTDVSDREKRFADLRESEERYRLLVEALLIGVWITLDDVITYANPVLVRALGYSKVEDVAGRYILDMIAEDRRAEIKRIRRDVLISGAAAVDVPVTLLRADGGGLPVLATINRVEREGGFATQSLFRGPGGTDLLPSGS